MTEINQPNPFNQQSDGASSSRGQSNINPALANSINVQPISADHSTHQSSFSRRKIISIVASSLLAIVLVVGGAFLIGHFSLVSTCQSGLEAYNQQADDLRELLDDSQDLLDITTDDVLDTDKSIVNNFQSAYKQAREELEKQPDENQCASGRSNDELTQAIADLASSYNLLSELGYRIDDGGADVELANEIKLLADAKSALSSTLLSAQTLSQNRVVSASVRTQLNRAISLASGILETGDLDDIESARDQLDDIIQQVNDALSAENEAIIDIEEAVSQIATYVGSDGSYTESAVQILSAAGLEPVWGLERMRGACQISNEQLSSWLAAFCSATPGKVYINTNLGTDVTNDAYFADAMRHEIAHYLIYRRCGTSDPPSIGNQANAESVASSYAVLYLGANAKTLNRALDSRYHMDQASDEAAARIHAGQCY